MKRSLRRCVLSPFMTSRNATPRLSLRSGQGTPPAMLRERLTVAGFGAVQWPWLLRSLYGGTQASKARLLERLELSADALPFLGSWKADTHLLHRIVDMVESEAPRTVVELGCGASTLVLARALQVCGLRSRLVSYDQHAGFVAATRLWLAEQGLSADLRHGPITERCEDWPGLWYRLDHLPDTIDLLVIDGPPWTVHPYVRGAAELLFPRLAPGGVVMLDDAFRPGERVVARRWRRRWPDIAFELEPGGSKGLLVGRKLGDAASSLVRSRSAA